MHSQAKTVVYIDDDDDDRLLVRSIMERFHPEINMIEFDNAEEALFYLKQLKEGGRPGLIILDINMPKVDGRMALTEIQKDKDLSSIPVVLFTTSSSELDRSFARSRHVLLFTKPPEAESLINAVEELLTHAV
jgi:CheY-like chemotaxis protein